MATDTPLRLYNTLTREKAAFQPIDPANVRMYVCGPTVYDFAHIGNARPVIVFDVLFRLLRHLYGPEHVTYVRNITDVDDKINARAARDFPGLPLNEAIRRVTEKTAAQFEKDAAALGCLPPTVEPRATDNIGQMQTLIATLLQNGHAYFAEEAGEVLFDVGSMPDYGRLSRRPLDENIAGARVAVDAHKKNPADFVLWKRSSAEEPGWDSPWGRGRPGWHIECSAMSGRYLGETFDIHGGGLDLIFPHHENEIAQSRCAHGTPVMANVWMHNGFLQVEGQKMSKSLGNFVTIHELLETDKFGDRPWPGEVLRWAMLMTHYRQPIDFSVSRLSEAHADLNDFAVYSSDTEALKSAVLDQARGIPPTPSAELVAALSDDLNSGEVRRALRGHISSRVGREQAAARLIADCRFLGLMRPDQIGVLSTGMSVRGVDWSGLITISDHLLPALANNNSDAINSISSELAHSGRTFEQDWQGFVTFVGIEVNLSDAEIDRARDARLAALNAKDFAKADAIRADLLAQGIQLMDYKDPATGERRTKWEVKR